VEDWSVDTNASDNRRIQLPLNNLKTAAILDDAEKIDDPNLASSGLARITAELQHQTLSGSIIKKGQPVPETPPICKFWYHTIRGFSRRTI